MLKHVVLPLLLIGFCIQAGAQRACAQTLLVVNQGDKTLSLVDPQSATQIAVVDEGLAGVWGHEITVSPDGRTAYMPIYGSAGVGRPGIDGHELLVIDVKSRKIVGDLDFGHGVRPHLPVFDPAKGLLYVTTELDNSVTIPQEILMRPDGKIAYVSCNRSGKVAAIDLSQWKVQTLIAAGQFADGLAWAQ